MRLVVPSVRTSLLSPTPRTPSLPLQRVTAPVKALDISNTNSLLKPETSMSELEALVGGLKTDRPRLSTTEVIAWTLLMHLGILL